MGDLGATNKATRPTGDDVPDADNAISGEDLFVHPNFRARVSDGPVYKGSGITTVLVHHIVIVHNAIYNLYSLFGCSVFVFLSANCLLRE